MKAHIVLAHPEPKSFNGHLAGLSRQTVEVAGGTATLSDLYAMDFDPREGAHHFPSRKDPTAFHAQGEQRHSVDQGTRPAVPAAEAVRMLESDLLIVHFPLWWFGPPAMLKGWMDRVFAYGAIYTSTKRYDAGVCAGKRMIACVTTGASAESCSPNGREGDTRLLLWPVLFPFRYLGYQVLEPQIFHGVGGVDFLEGAEGGLSPIQRLSAEWCETLAGLDTRPAVPHNSDDEFDETKRLKPGAPSHSPFIRQPS